MTKTKEPLWYIQKKGRTEGPVPAETIAHAINKGELGPFDLVFRDGESRWQPLSDVSQFASLFQAKKAAPSEEDSWVVLVKSKNQKDRRQAGPYTTSQVRVMLKAGQLQLTDYVWKDGMKEWYRIHSLDLFHQERTSTAVTRPNIPSIDAPREELLKSVKVMKHPEPPPLDPVPLEAIDFDLTKTNARIEPSAKRTPKSPAQAAAMPPRVVKRKNKDEKSQITNVRRLSLTDRAAAAFKSIRWPKRAAFRFGIAAGMGLAVVGALYFMSYADWRDFWSDSKPAVTKERRDRWERPDRPERSKDPVAPAPTVNVVRNAPAGKDPSPTPTPVKEDPVVTPAYLRLRVQQAQSPGAVIDLQTNASKHFSVTLRIIGDTGRVIGVKSFYKEVKVKGVEGRRVSVGDLKLPPGYYNLWAQVGDFEDRASLSWRLFDKNFRSEFSGHRKSIVHFATMERYYLVKSAEFLEDKANDLIARVGKDGGKGLSGFYKDWSKSLSRAPGSYLKSISARNRKDYVYAEEWLKLRELRNNLSTAGKKLVAAKDKGAPEASFDLRQLSVELGRQKEAALKASLWQ